LPLTKPTSRPSPSSYFPLLQIADLSDIREEILSRVSVTIGQACEYRNSYNPYAYLWVDDRQEFLHQFLLYGHMLTQEEIEAAGTAVPGVGELTVWRENLVGITFGDFSWNTVFLNLAKFKCSPSTKK